ncbi:MAG: hypothetical protein M3P18_07765 [Actinomycetota bacterium]|nr:hypothetical protein [Actinomycetota bacterium]
MRSLALMVGMFGGSAGIYFALVLAMASGQFGAIASLSGSRGVADPP